ncbi:O-methyltransferase-domain-containing protein [Xylariaceae sp. FL1019]|nr:O-methyltransferase-domain-containing protein [Xylariaceae sp. FL1019]
MMSESMTTATFKISTLLERIQARGKAFELQAGESTQRQLLGAARALVDALESPAERVTRMIYHEPYIYSITRVCIDLDLFTTLLSDNGSPKSTKFLAQASGADQKLLKRLLKHLATSSVIDEIDIDTFGPTAISALLATPECSGAVMDMYDAGTDHHNHLPAFLKANNYQNPTDRTKLSLWRYATGCELPYFDWLNLPENSARRDAFERHMAFKTLSKKWYEAVPLDEVLRKEVEGDALLVDIGGNTGYDLQGFHKAHPDRPGKLILQDTPSVVEAVKLESPFEVMAHDMFTPQPVKGANAYYMKMVLHDWGDEDCQRILSNIKPAMKKGKSKILVNEMVIPQKNAEWFATGVDIIMLNTHSSYERTERDWERLAESAGLKVNRIWDCDGAHEKLIEMVIP